jgi:hypothetical protein
MYLTINYISRVLIHTSELRIINAENAATLNSTITTGTHLRTQIQIRSTHKKTKLTESDSNECITIYTTTEKESA